MLDSLDLPADLLTILFGVGVLQVLLTAPAGLAAQMPKDLARLWGLLTRGDPRRTAGRGAGALIEIDDLTVRFGGVTPLDGMTVRFEAGTCGLIGPNGAGKTTFFNVLSGFVAPASGRIHAFGDDLLAMAALPPRALGPAANVPDRAGDRGAVGRGERRARA